MQANLDVEPVQQVEIKEPAEESNFETTGPKWPININHGFNLRWILGATGLVILVGLSYLGWNAFGSQLFHLTATSTHAIIPTRVPTKHPTQTPTQNPTQTPTPTSTPTMIPSLTPTSTVEVMEAPQAIHAALDYIQETDPTFEDDFSTPKAVWGSFENAYGVVPGADWYRQPISEVVYDGVLHVEGAPSENDVARTKFGTFNKFQSSNFVFEYEYKIENQLEYGEAVHGFVIRDDGNLGINLQVDIDGDMARISGDPDRWHHIKDPAGIAGQNKGTLRVIAYGEDIAFYFDNKLIISCKDQDYDGNENFIFVSGEEYRLLIDNVKFWNLDGVEFPQE
ncbi:MAG: hypothetical protein KGY39_04855 [Anaerolineales bacterium]|nr:hypothetical protein [Anaerolineales bacterium]MBS3753285.1 hypothetical protein [Anaerolineales bacterium]